MFWLRGRLDKRGSLGNLPNVILIIAVVIIVSLIVFYIIGVLEPQMNLTGTWNTTYQTFASDIQDVWPLITVLVIVSLVMGILAAVMFFRTRGR